MDSEGLHLILALLSDYGRTLDGGVVHEPPGLHAENRQLHVDGSHPVGKEEMRRFMRLAHRGKPFPGLSHVRLDGNPTREPSDFLILGSDGPARDRGNLRG